MGNEARFVNDYRNTGRRPNVEFRLRRDRRGELRQGVYVAAKAGVAAGEELLINYGKPFWRARAGGRSLEEFVRVRPQAQGQAKRRTALPHAARARVTEAPRSLRSGFTAGVGSIWSAEASERLKNLSGAYLRRY